MNLLAALSQPRRQEILRLVADRELSAGEIHRAVGEVTFGAVSQHLRVLTEAGAVRARRDGRRRLYRARRGALRPFLGYLEKLWAGKLDDLKRLVESERGSAGEGGRDPGARRSRAGGPRRAMPDGGRSEAEPPRRSARAGASE